MLKSQRSCSIQRLFRKWWGGRGTWGVLLNPHHSCAVINMKQRSVTSLISDQSDQCHWTLSKHLLIWFTDLKRSPQATVCSVPT